MAESDVVSSTGDEDSHDAVEKDKSENGTEEEEMKKEAERFLQEAQKERPFQMYAALAFAVLMIIVGLPLWWKTTAVYRSDLPLSRIAQLSHHPLSIPVSVNLVWFNQKSKAAAKAAKKLLGTTLSAESQGTARILYEVDVRVKEASLGHSTIVSSAKSLEELADALPLPDIEPDLPLTFFLLPDSFQFGDRRTELLWTQGTFALVRDLPSERLAELLADAVSETYLNAPRLTRMANRTETRQPGPRLSEEDLEEFVRPDQILEFYLVNPRPDECGSGSLDLGSQLEDLLRPLQSRLEPVSRVRIRSQTLYYVNLAVTPRFDADKGVFLVDAKQLPHSINLVERYAVSVEAKEPVLHLLLYIPPPESQPLFIVDAEGARVRYNSFLVSGWGGVIVWNAACNASLESLPDTLQESVLAELRALLGLNGAVSPGMRRMKSPVALWEVQRLMFQATVENVSGATRTLQSLTRLLEAIKNIVIGDEVGEGIRASVEATEQSLAALDNGDLVSALASSRRAVADAERAFFDHSLLALLYFPDDQKYAIYIPLFLPVGVPVLLSLRQIYIYFRKK